LSDLREGGDEKRNLFRGEFLEQRKAFHYSLEITEMALRHRDPWKLSIFKRDLGLYRSKGFFEMAGVNMEAFFSIGEVIDGEQITSLYEWAREVQKRVASGYDLILREEQLGRLEGYLHRLDSSYQQREYSSPIDYFNEVELGDFKGQIIYLKEAYGLGFEIEN
jgi:hypothetical protein